MPAFDDAPEIALLPLAPAVREDLALVVVSGVAAGRHLRVPRDGGTIGCSGVDVDLTIPDPGISERHASILRASPTAFVIRDLGSRFGLRVESQHVLEATLFDGARVQLSESTIVRVRHHEPRELLEPSPITHDTFTGAMNRRQFLLRLEEELAFSSRHGAPLALLFLDVDGLGEINAKHGRPTGDDVLRSVARALASALRLEDVVARYGQDEFVVLARGLDGPSSIQLAERLRRTLRDKMTSPASVSVTIGVARWHKKDRATAMELVARADAALHRAKLLGRDRVETWVEQG